MMHPKMLAMLKSLLCWLGIFVSTRTQPTQEDVGERPVSRLLGAQLLVIVQELRSRLGDTRCP